MKIKLQISYEGTPFYGWQKQPDDRPTVQGHIEQALTKIFNQPISTIASGRTDAGVHALQQFLHFEVDSYPSSLKLVHALNSLTPEEIAVHYAWEAPDDFHALLSCQSKTYKYLILNSPLPSAFRSRFTTWVHKPLDLQRLQKITSPLKGEHDFKSFQTSGTPVPSTVRQITHIGWERRPGHIVEFSITGTGFLKQMVRNIVGTSLDLHKNQLDSEKMVEILNARDRRAALGTAPARGLYLFEVEYPSALDNKCRKI